MKLAVNKSAHTCSSCCNMYPMYSLNLGSLLCFSACGCCSYSISKGPPPPKHQPKCSDPTERSKCCHPPLPAVLCFSVESEKVRMSVLYIFCIHIIILSAWLTELLSQHFKRPISTPATWISWEGKCFAVLCFFVGIKK